MHHLHYYVMKLIAVIYCSKFLQLNIIIDVNHESVCVITCNVCFVCSRTDEENFEDYGVVDLESDSSDANIS